VNYPLVLITWEDSVRPQGAWVWLEDFEIGKVVLIKSVGWLLADGDVKALAPNIGGTDGPTEQACGIIHIPARCVVSCEVLAQGTEARRAETGTGSVHDGPVAESHAPECSIPPER
jgi:hypothetical protein